MNLGLRGKVALVSGASKGLGYAVARALAGEGAHVSIASRDAAAIREAAARIEGDTGATVLATALDVRSAEGIEAWVAASAERFGGIDALMTNSGGPPAGAAIAFDDRAWQDAADLLLFSALRMVRAAVPHMQQRGGGAILVSTSASVKEPIPNLGLSTVLRASVSALAKTLAIELAPSKIRVNQIIPGSSTKSPARSWGFRPPMRRRGRWGRSRSAATASRTNSAASARSCCPTRRPT
jgi:3-oxoacyl-[acyl-carrier protein] reductase